MAHRDGLQTQGLQHKLLESAGGWESGLHALELFMGLSEADPVQYRESGNFQGDSEFSFQCS